MGGDSRNAWGWCWEARESDTEIETAVQILFPLHPLIPNLPYIIQFAIIILIIILISSLFRPSRSLHVNE